MYSGHILIPYFKIHNINKQETTTNDSTKDVHENPNGQREETEVTVVISREYTGGLVCQKYKYERFVCMLVEGQVFDRYE